MKIINKELEALLGTGWTVESDNGNNPESLKDIVLKSYLQEDERYATGETIQKRQGKDKPLNADCFLRLWTHQEEIPKSWKEKTDGNTTYIFFDGTVVRGPSGDRYSLCLCWDGGQWSWYYGWLGYYRGAGSPSAVVASGTRGSGTKTSSDTWSLGSELPDEITLNGRKYRAI